MRKSASSTRRTSIPNWLHELWQTYVASGDFTAVLVTIVLLLMPAFALKAADWPIQENILLPVTVLSIVFGYFLSRSRYNELYALVVAAVYGVIVVLIIAAFSYTVNVVRGFEIVIYRTMQWTVDAFTGGINQDNLVFTMVVSILFWFFGYNATWHIFRIDRVWRVIIPPGLILLVNMVVYAGDSNLDLYLMSFVLMGLLLIVRSNLDAREWDWYSNGVRVPHRLRRQFTMVGAGISLVALLLAWSIPSGALQERLNNFQQFLASDPIRRLSEIMNRLVEPIESEGPATADYYGGDSLNLGGAIRLGDQVIMFIKAPQEQHVYWRSRVFERYVNGRWTPSATLRVPDFSPPLEINQPSGGDLGRQVLTQVITMNSPSRLIYAAPQPISVNIAGRMDLVRTSENQTDTNSPVNVSVIRPEKVIERGQSYEVTSEISVATAEQLRSAGTNYPEWVSQANTYAGGISGNTAGLARQIVENAGAITVYDQAKAIETYLRNNISYNESIPTPPPGVDPIDWFLFTEQQGYCTYYATAMVAMLRTLGIPARMAAGFASGEYNAELDQYVIKEKDAHTWVEVYFPGYGWVEFEPTSDKEPINREGEPPNPSQNNPDIQTPTPIPTNTPTPAPSPTPLPSPTQSDSAGQQQNQPTPTPSPSATPVILPTPTVIVAPPPPPSAPILGWLVQALGLAFLIFASILILVLLALFTYWWWEYRGMGGLSPISKAYARLMRYLSLIGFRSADNETPEERRRRIVRNLPQAERPVSAITRAYTVERYSQADEGTPENDYHSQIADNAWPHARRNILWRWVRKFTPFLRD